MISCKEQSAFIASDMASEHLSYVDFTPSLLEPATCNKPPVYAKFNALTSAANEWLACNPEVKVISCETLKVKTRIDLPPSPDISYQNENDRKCSLQVSCLRLWWAPKDKKESDTIQTLAYKDIIPAQTLSGSKSGKPFDTLRDCLLKFNAGLKDRPLPGQPISVETLATRITDPNANVEPDITCQPISGGKNLKELTFLRLFYELGDSYMGEMGSVDFVPAYLGPAHYCSNPPKFESFSVTVERARQWLRQHTEIGVISVQSVCLKVHNAIDEKNIDSLQTLNCDRNQTHGYFLRFVRIIFHKLSLPPPPVALTCKTFLPAQLTLPGGCDLSPPKYENLRENLQRVTVWIQLTGARVVSVETDVIHKSHQQGKADPDQSSFKAAVRIPCIRVFLDGCHREPDPELLPSIPELPLGDWCCQIM